MAVEETTSGIVSLEAVMTDDPFGFEETAAAATKTTATEKTDFFVKGEEDSSLKDNENKTSKEDNDGENPKGTTSSREKQPDGDQKSDSTEKGYHRQLKKLFGDSIQTVVQVKDGNEVEVPIEEVDLDEESFTELVQQQMALEKEKITAGKLVVDGATELTKALINIEQKGGNITELLEHKRDFVDPLNDIDLTTTEGQKQALSLYLEATGQDARQIKAQVILAESEGTLEDEARDAEAALRNAMTNAAKAEEQKIDDAVKLAKERMKVYKKAFRENLDRFELNEASKTRLVEFATKQGEDKKFDLDRKLAEARRDPEKAVELALWLEDRDEYIRQITNKKVTETKQGTFLKLGVVAANKKTGDLDFTNKNNNDKEVGKNNVEFFD